MVEHHLSGGKYLGDMRVNIGVSGWPPRDGRCRFQRRFPRERRGQIWLGSAGGGRKMRNRSKHMESCKKREMGDKPSHGRRHAEIFGEEGWASCFEESNTQSYLAFQANKHKRKGELKFLSPQKTETWIKEIFISNASTNICGIELKSKILVRRGRRDVFGDNRLRCCWGFLDDDGRWDAIKMHHKKPNRENKTLKIGRSRFLRWSAFAHWGVCEVGKKEHQGEKKIFKKINLCVQMMFSLYCWV